jgi:nitrilase
LTFLAGPPKNCPARRRKAASNSAGPLFNEDAILLAEVDLVEIARGKYDFDVVGHYARPDVFRLHVNEKPAPPVIVD